MLSCSPYNSLTKSISISAILHMRKVEVQKVLAQTTREWQTWRLSLESLRFTPTCCFVPGGRRPTQAWRAPFQHTAPGPHPCLLWAAQGSAPWEPPPCVPVSAVPPETCQSLLLTWKEDFCHHASKREGKRKTELNTTQYWPAVKAYPNNPS